VLISEIDGPYAGAGADVEDYSQKIRCLGHILGPILPTLVHLLGQWSQKQSVVERLEEQVM